MADVRRTRAGVRVRLAAEESGLLRSLMEQLLALIGEPPARKPADPDDPLSALGIAEEAVKPDDPVLARLFPDAYGDPGAEPGGDEAEAADDFRRYTELGLRDGKRDAAATVLKALPDAGGTVVLDGEQAQAWLRALNDVRLALGTRLDISEEWYDEAGHLDRDDPRTPMFAAYDWLTMLQEGLVQALL
ncbi:DUF2017 domain-containing protein [Actinomadura sp. WMMB 499]|uniref:DUF2017 domain-containing protein n=1 Tax=Actinomadura sp. WMMB 499 TaxID=1219491 RepID=UPI0012487A10|nr:DUF2017 domain-containing protein [Actinomadura sp. WMMB 499]QFG24319.1 DUF2017 domain-containing protein [Actinomadura sp. WMMB 499]